MSTPAQKIYKRLQKNKRAPVVVVATAAPAVASIMTRARSLPGTPGVAQKIYKRLQKKRGKLTKRPASVAAAVLKLPSASADAPIRAPRRGYANLDPHAPSGEKFRAAALENIDRQLDDLEAFVEQQAPSRRPLAAVIAKPPGPVGQRQRSGMAAAEARYEKKMAEIDRKYKARMAQADKIDAMADELSALYKRASLAQTPSFQLLTKDEITRQALEKIKEDVDQLPVVKIISTRPHPARPLHPAYDEDYVESRTAYRGYQPGTARADPGEQRPYLDAFGKPISLKARKQYNWDD